MRFGVAIPLLGDADVRDPMRAAYEWCTRAESLGFEFASVGHHRFTPGYGTSPWVFLAAIAARTSTLHLGTGVFLLPLDHPLDVAEEVAALDQVSGGRAFLGAGLGYGRYEWDALGLPYEGRGTRMTEALEMVQRAWTEEKVSFHGEHFDFDGVEVLPKPVQQPRPRVWVGPNVGPGIRRASRLADVAQFRAASADHGRAGEICLMRLVGIGASRDEVERDWLPPVLASLRSYRRAGAPGERDEDCVEEAPPLRRRTHPGRARQRHVRHGHARRRDRGHPPMLGAHRVRALHALVRWPRLLDRARAVRPHWLLVEHLGVKRVLDFVLRKRIVDGDAAAALGLVTESVDDDQLLERALELATELATGPQVATRLLKRAVYNAAHLTYEQAGDDIATKTAISDFHDDAHDGSQAFFEKRDPVFNSWLEDGGSPA